MTSGLFPAIFAARNGVKFKQAGLIVCVDGTAYPGAPGIPPPGAGFSSDMAYALMDQADGLWNHQFVCYPASTIPMGASVQIGRANCVACIQNYANAYFAAHGSYVGLVIKLTGYSQGAMVTDLVWTQDILALNGTLHYLLPYVWRVYNYGDPYRCPGIANGNLLAGQPLPPQVDGATTGGIGGALDLTPAQTNVLAPDGKPVVTSFANHGDLYADCPVGDNPWSAESASGHVGSLIFNLIQKPSFMSVLSIAGAIGTPIGMVEEIIHGMTFAAQGPNAPHWKYQDGMNAAVGEMITIGRELIAA